MMKAIPFCIGALVALSMAALHWWLCLLGCEGLDPEQAALSDAAERANVHGKP